jgi:hypothetical protein
LTALQIAHSWKCVADSAAALLAAAPAAGCKRKFDIAKYVSWVNKEVCAAEHDSCIAICLACVQR